MKKKMTKKKINVQYWVIWASYYFFFLILFIKPEEIPKISKNLGLFYRKINRYIFNLKYELDEIEVISSDSKVSKKNLKKKLKAINEISWISKRIEK